MVLVVLGEKLLGVREMQAGPGHQVDQALRGELVVKFLVERVVLADLVHREDKPLGAPAALRDWEHREHHLDLEAAHLAGLVDLEDLARPAEEHLAYQEEHQEENHLVLEHQADREGEHPGVHLDLEFLADRGVHPAGLKAEHLEVQPALEAADQEHPEAHLDLVEECPEEAQVVREKVQLALVVAHPAAARLVLELLADREEHLVEHPEEDHLAQAVAHLVEVRLDRVEEHPADHLVLEHLAGLEAEHSGVHLVPGEEHLAEHLEERLAEEHPEVHLALEAAHLAGLVDLARPAEEHLVDREEHLEEHPEDLAEKPLEVPAEPAESASLAERDRIPQLTLELAHLPALTLAQEQVHMVL